MAQLLVRKLEKEVVQKLREQAARHGVSMEEEHRRILRNILLKTRRSPTKERPKRIRKLNFKEFLLTAPYFGDPDSLRSRELPREIDFD
jgi:plasmid stability protein